MGRRISCQAGHCYLGAIKKLLPGQSQDRRQQFLFLKNNESFLERICQLEYEVKELKNQIINKDISFTKAENEIITKLEEIQALQLEIKELEMKYFLAQKDLSEMDSLIRQELVQTRQIIVFQKKFLVRVGSTGRTCDDDQLEKF